MIEPEDNTFRLTTLDGRALFLRSRDNVRRGDRGRLASHHLKRRIS